MPEEREQQAGNDHSPEPQVKPTRAERKAERKADRSRRAKKRRAEAATGVSRRAFVTAAGTGAAATLLLKVTPEVQGRTWNPDLIRPPGSLAEDEFLDRCLRCGACMKVCPTNALHPTLLQAGLAGLWTPYLVPAIGYCEYNCTLCGQVCPTGAIEELDLATKQERRIGTAAVDRSRCLPWVYDTDCVVCEEHCPLPEKAIWLEDVEVVNRDGERIELHRPHVDAELCNGCGICETKCPVNDPAAILVASGGEDRNPDNQFLLSGFSW